LRYSDLAGKEIIDIDQGVRLGIINDTDLVIDTDAGRVVSIIIPGRGGLWSRRELEIPWHGIRKIGVDLIIVDLSTAAGVHDRGGRSLDHPHGAGPLQGPPPAWEETVWDDGPGQDALKWERR